MTNKEIVNFLLNEYPLKDQDEWDNSSFINNNIDSFNNICISLDVNIECVKQCINNKIGLLITHHPIYIGDINEQSNKKDLNKILSLCKKNNISILSLHTNFDKSSNGMNVELAKILNLSKIKKNKKYYGVIGTATKETNIYNICDYFQTNKKIGNILNKKIYICGGSGSSEVEQLLDKNIDVFITGEVKWHIYNNTIGKNKIVIDVGHQAEKIFIDTIYKLIKDKCNNILRIYPNIFLNKNNK